MEKNLEENLAHVINNYLITPESGSPDINSHFTRLLIANFLSSRED